MRARRYIAVFLCGLLPLSAGGASSIDWTLCLADDGHATIEIAHGDSACWSDVRRHHGALTALHISELDHHSCTDIPIVEGRASHASLQKPPLAYVSEISSRVGTVGGAQQRATSDRETRSQIDQTLRSRRSVVLIV